MIDVNVSDFLEGVLVIDVMVGEKRMSKHKIPRSNKIQKHGHPQKVL